MNESSDNDAKKRLREQVEHEIRARREPEPKADDPASTGDGARAEITAEIERRLAARTSEIKVPADQKPEAEKAEDKKAADNKAEPAKAADKPADDKKPEPAKADQKPAEEKKPEDQKSEPAKAEEKPAASGDAAAADKSASAEARRKELEEEVRKRLDDRRKTRADGPDAKAEETADKPAEDKKTSEPATDGKAEGKDAEETTAGRKKRAAMPPPKGKGAARKRPVGGKAAGKERSAEASEQSRLIREHKELIEKQSRKQMWIMYGVVTVIFALVLAVLVVVTSRRGGNGGNGGNSSPENGGGTTIVAPPPEDDGDAAMPPAGDGGAYANRAAWSRAATAAKDARDAGDWRAAHEVWDPFTKSRNEAYANAAIAQQEKLRQAYLASDDASDDLRALAGAAMATMTAGPQAILEQLDKIRAFREAQPEDSFAIVIADELAVRLNRAYAKAAAGGGDDAIIDPGAMPRDDDDAPPAADPAEPAAPDGGFTEDLPDL